MTRNFNKQRRNDPNTYQHEPFRNTPSNSSDNARPLRSPRPRLSREMVDRAWREGAQHSHPDYHPRDVTNSHPQPRRGYQSNQRPEHPAPSNKFGNQPGNQNHRRFDRDNTRRFEQHSPDAQAPHSSSFPTGERPNSRRMPMNSAYPETRQGRFERGPARRWQQDEQFEGDYERFTGHDEVDERRSNGYRQPSRARQNEMPARRPRPERSRVTPLSDGHVIKGPRPAQRKNARFWQDVASDTDQLLHKVHTPREQPFPSNNAAASRQGKKHTTAPTTHNNKKNANPTRTGGPGRPRTNPRRPAF